MKQFAIAILCLGFSLSALSHEGHQHAPAPKAAPNGGRLKVGKEITLEVVGTKSEVKIYPYDHDMKELPLSQVKLSGEFVIPRKKIRQPLTLTAAGNHWQATVDAKDTHRYDLDFQLEHGGKSEKMKFTLEPK